MNEQPAMATGSQPGAALSTQLALEGAMTIYEAVAMKQQLLSALDAGPRLVIDLSRVDELDTAGLQLLVLAQREATRGGKLLQVSARSAAVDEVLGRYGLGDAFDPSVAIARDIAALAEAIASERNSHEP